MFLLSCLHFIFIFIHIYYPITLLSPFDMLLFFPLLESLFIPFFYFVSQWLNFKHWDTRETTDERARVIKITHCDKNPSKYLNSQTKANQLPILQNDDTPSDLRDQTQRTKYTRTYPHFNSLLYFTRFTSYINSYNYLYYKLQKYSFVHSLIKASQSSQSYWLWIESPLLHWLATSFFSIYFFYMLLVNISVSVLYPALSIIAANNTTKSCHDIEIKFINCHRCRLHNHLFTLTEKKSYAVD